MTRVCDDLIVGNFTFDGFLDHDDEMELACETYYSIEREWINKEKAQALVAHLNKVFNLNP